MNTRLAALALTGIVSTVSVGALAGATSPSMGAPASQTGADPRTIGNDPARQGVGTDDNGGTGKGIGILGAGSTTNIADDSDDQKDGADLPGSPDSGKSGKPSDDDDDDDDSDDSGS